MIDTLGFLYIFPNREPIARNTDPQTSHRSATELTTSGKRDAQKARVLTAVKDHPGLTSSELARISGLDRYLVARRLPDLRNDRLVYNGQARECSVTRKQALTWIGRK